MTGDGRRVIGRSTAPAERRIPGSRRVVGSGGASGPPTSAPAGRGAGPGDRSVPAERRRRHRPRPRTVVAIVLALVVLVPIGGVSLGWWEYSRIATVDVASALSPRSGRKGTNYLIVGTDSREGITASDPNAAAFLSGDVAGSRTDTLLVLHVEGASSTITSVPRDLWVTDPATGQKGRINSTFATGPANTIHAVEQLGIPVDHYLQIDFVAFSRLVDALGGITIDFPHPARDEHSGLYVDVAGPVRLDGPGALAYVRSRYYTELVDGRWRVDGTADIGRTIRQRAFLTALLRTASSTRDPATILRLPGALRGGLVRDTTFGFLDAVRLARTMSGARPEAVALPVSPRRTSGGAEVLELQPDATAVIATLAG